MGHSHKLNGSFSSTTPGSNFWWKKVLERGIIKWWIGFEDAVLVQNIFFEYAPKTNSNNLKCTKTAIWHLIIHFGEKIAPKLKFWKWGEKSRAHLQFWCISIVRIHTFGAYSEKIFCTKTASAEQIHHVILPRSNTPGV